MNAASPRALDACVLGIGVLGPGLADWASAAAVLSGQQAYLAARTELPAPQSLPPAERRRATASVKLALACGSQALAMAGRGAEDLRTVFAGSGGDGMNCHALCEALASSDRLVSPTRFHNSVHNAASGYWGIAMHAMAPSTVLCAPDDTTFAAGLLDALVQLRTCDDDVLLLVYDTDYPQPLRGVRPIPDSFGVALLLSPPERARGLARIVVDAAGPAPERAACGVDEPALEALRRQIPAARCLPLLQRLARREAASVVVDHLPGRRLALEVAPC